ncbi:calcium-binding protein [Mameliella sediminis]|uniref:calcium-binding protein n=1 Tax=Mameliella sediminis TaxID=2836866 RepID=UPI001C46893E|nr:calcium-binding protein [Mameliella sediminis]MBV7393104.1 hypothetical protein [Mameliella sediminis]
MPFFQIDKGVSGLLGGNGFSSIANVLTIAGTVYTIASEIYAHVNGNGTFNDVEDPNLAAIAELKDEIEQLQDDIVEMERALTELIISEFSDLQQQLLASAQSRAASALDLLASYSIDPDIDRAEIIADASRALRDALAQATQMMEPSDPPTALNALKAGIAAVAYTLYVRMEVARELEGDEIASDKISRQIEDVMAFFEDVVEYVLTRVTAVPISNFRYEAYLDGAPFPEFYSAGFDQIEGRSAYGYGGSPFIFDPAGVTAEDFEGPYQIDGSPNDYYLPSLDRIITIQESRYYDSAGNPVASTHPDARSGLDLWRAEMEAWVIEQTLQWFGIDRAAFAETIAGFRDLTDGEQFVLPSIPGFENDGTIVGTDGDDLIVGNDGHDLLQGGGDPDLIRGMEGNDTVQGGSGGDRLEGNEGNDLLEGGADNDALIGGPGDDTIDGGPGLDLAIYSGRRSEYTVTTYQQGGIRYVQVDGPEGTDTLTNVERLVFDNRIVQIQTGDGAPPLLGDILFSDGSRRLADDLIFMTVLSGTGSAEGGMGDDTISASIGNSIIDGGPGNDILTGSWLSFAAYSSVAVFSGLRSDYVIQTPQQVLDPIVQISGPDGVDQLSGFTALQFDDMTVGIIRATFNFGTLSANPAIGTLSDDILLGLAAPGRLEGRNGDDTILGGAGDDTILGGDGGSGPDGGDLIEAGAGDDLVRGDAGNDTIRGQAGHDTLNGGAGQDILDGGTDLDTASFADSDAPVRVALYNNTAMGGHAAGDSLISIENLIGSEFGDELSGDSGANIIEGGAGGDQIYGGFNSDTASYAGSDSAVRVGLFNNSASGGHASGDMLVSIENLIGSDFNDELSGDSGRNTIEGGDGADRIYGGFSADTASYAGSDAGVRVGLFNNSATGGDATGDTLVSIENLTGSDHDDVLSGNGGRNILIGGDGDDQLYGGGSSDTLDGGSGNDTLSGGPGGDHFVFGTQSGQDTVLDFEDGTDLIQLTGGLTFADLTVTTVASGQRIALASDPSVHITLEGLNPGDITADDFT